MSPLLSRTRTAPNAGGILVEVTDGAGATKRAYAMVHKLHPDYGPYRWHVSDGRIGQSPLFVGAVLASAHAIDESEATL